MNQVYQSKQHARSFSLTLFFFTFTQSCSLCLTVCLSLSLSSFCHSLSLSLSLSFYLTHSCLLHITHSICLSVPFLCLLFIFSFLFILFYECPLRQNIYTIAGVEQSENSFEQFIMEQINLLKTQESYNYCLAVFCSQM